MLLLLYNKYLPLFCSFTALSPVSLLYGDWIHNIGSWDIINAMQSGAGRLPRCKLPASLSELPGSSVDSHPQPSCSSGAGPRRHCSSGSEARLLSRSQVVEREAGAGAGSAGSEGFRKKESMSDERHGGALLEGAEPTYQLFYCVWRLRLSKRRNCMGGR